MDNEDPRLSHQQFYEWFQSFWAKPSGAAVAQKFLPDAKIHFTGVGIMSGAEYVGWMDELLLQQPGLVVTPIDFAGAGDLVYIHWTAASTIDGKNYEWYGVDRFRLANDMVVEEHVIFDSAALQTPSDEE